MPALYAMIERQAPDAVTAALRGWRTVFTV